MSRSGAIAIETDTSLEITILPQQLQMHEDTEEVKFEGVFKNIEVTIYFEGDYFYVLLNPKQQLSGDFLFDCRVEVYQGAEYQNLVLRSVACSAPYLHLSAVVGEFLENNNFDLDASSKICLDFSQQFYDDEESCSTIGFQ